MTEIDTFSEANADAGAFVIVGVRSDGTDNEDRLAVSRSSYHQLTRGGTNWREADVVVDDDGSTVFRAAGLLDDGTLVGHAEFRGPGARTASLRIEPDGRWSSVVESGLERTEAFGRLRKPDQPIKLRRKHSRRGKTLWTADAKTQFNVAGSDGTRFVRVTTGTVKYANGGAGTFATNVVGSIGTRHLIEDSHAGWDRFDAGPGKDGFSKMTPLPGGIGNREVVQEIVDRGTGAVSRETTTYGSKKVDGREVHSITKKDEFFPGTGPGRPSATSTSEQTVDRPDGASWTKTTTAADGSKKVERGEWVMGPQGSSMTTSTENPDHSITTQTTTWDNSTHRGEQHTVTTGPNGEVREDTTTSGSIHLPQGTYHRPGDIGKVYEPDPPSGQDGSDDGGTDDGSGTQEDGDHEDDDDDHGSGGDNQGSGEEEGAPLGDGEGGDDTGGYPGLGWDGGGDGPLALLPALAASALGHFDDPNQPTDDLGDDTGVSDIVARAYRFAIRQGGRGQNAGLGSDVEDPLHGIAEDVLLAAARKAPPVDPEWGDWSNPKAHSDFVTAIVTSLGAEVKSKVAVQISSSFNKFF